MDKSEFTITEAASQLKVSRQTIYKKVDDLKDELDKHITVKDGVKYLSLQALNIIKDNIKLLNKSNKINIDQNNDKQIEQISQVYDKLVSELQERIKSLEDEREQKNKQLADYNTRLAENNKLMENMQVLLNNYNKKQIVENIEQNRKWWQLWKS